MLVIKYHYDVNNAQLDRSRFTFIVILGAAAAARPGLTLLLSFFFYSFFFFSIFLYYIYFFLPTILIPSLTFSSLRSVCVYFRLFILPSHPPDGAPPPREKERKKKREKRRRTPRNRSSWNLLFFDVTHNTKNGKRKKRTGKNTKNNNKNENTQKTVEKITWHFSRNFWQGLEKLVSGGWVSRKKRKLTKQKKKKWGKNNNLTKSQNVFFFSTKEGNITRLPFSLLFLLLFIYIYIYFLPVMAQIESPGRTGGIERGGNTMRPSKKKKKERKK